MIIILSLTFCLTLFSCSESNSPAQKKEVTTQVKESGWLEKEPEEISEYAEDYELDLSKLSVNSNYGSYDTQTHILNVSEKWKSAQIWLSSFDASLYRYLRIDYEPLDSKPNQSFRFHCRYSDDADSYKLCERKRTTQYYILDAEKKKNIKSVFIQSITDEPLFTKINRICFTQNKVLSPAVKDSGGSASIKNISAVNLVNKMGIGWNLANTFEAHSFSWQENPLLQGLDSEFHWENIETTPELLKFAFDQGYKTIRIPVTWYNHIIDNNYTIDPDWMKRVKTIVDEAIKTGYYVILNEHHSVHGSHKTEFTVQDDGSKKFDSRAMTKPLTRGEGYLVCSDEESIAESKRFLCAVWTQIAEAFNTSYDEHLIFETMNEPRNARDDHAPEPKGRTDHEWEPGLKCAWYKSDGSVGGYWCDTTECRECLREYEVLNEYNQLCLNTIRKSGKNNANRFVIIPSLCTGADTLIHDKFKLPKDSASDKLILSAHYYPFGSSSEGTKENQTYTEVMKNNMKAQLKELNERFVSKGLPLVYGEVGAIKSKVSIAERINWITAFVSEARKYKMSVLYWDSGDDKESSMAQIDRKNLVLYEPEFFDAMMSAAKEE